MAGSAIRAIVVAHTRPLVGPSTPTTRAFVEIEKPGHASLLGSQTIITTRHEFQKSLVTQVLELLANLWPHILVTRVKFAEVPLESVNFIEREFAPAQRLHAFHDVEQPAACFKRFVSQEQRFLPFLKDSLLGTNDAVLNNVNLAGLRDIADQDIRPDPAGAACGCRERFAFFDNVANEKVLWNDEKD